MIPITSPQTLGNTLRQHRKAQGLTQSQAGEKFGIPQKTISRIEAGVASVRLETLFRYMAALGLELHLAPREARANQVEEPW